MSWWWRAYIASSLTDEEILAKFPSSQVSYDTVVETVFDSNDQPMDNQST
ncbi:hypothetical protein OK016_25355 [Vibrio chagasii]|nr:hypothetical protein [Vibrio chagasii]